jgi:hypothetical protein
LLQIAEEVAALNLTGNNNDQAAGDNSTTEKVGESTMNQNLNEGAGAAAALVSEVRKRVTQFCGEYGLHNS